MNTIKKISVIFIALSLVLSLTACNNKSEQTVKKTSYDNLKIGKGAENGAVAENDRFTLFWDGERACVLLNDKQNGTVWSTIPYDYYKTGDESGKAVSSMGAPLLLEYASSKNTAAIKTVNGYTGVIKNGRVSSKKIKNGIKVYYCFDKLKIVVPVDYTITDDGIKITISPSEIIEYDNLIYKISVAPFMCSAENGAGEDGYLVVPSGSGALIYADTDANGNIKEYSEQVYGTDPTRYESEKPLNLSSVRLPMFGAKDKDKALCGIIEEGAACAEIEAQAGNEKVGRSAVWVTFAVRGSNVSAVSFYGGQTTNVENINNEIGNYKRLTVGYYPLYGDDADYSGMAKIYRNKLNAGDQSGSVEESPLTLNILGGLQIKELMLGLPYQKTVAATTFKGALNIVESVAGVTELKTDVLLSGFGTTGLDVGKVGGGFKFDSVFGSKKDYSSFLNCCNSNNISIYADFDIVNFSSSSLGFSKTFDAAKAANSFTAYQNHYSPALRNADDSYSRYVLLSRAQLSKAADKVINTAKSKKLTGVGFSSLSSTAYSDYDSADYGVRHNMEEDVKAIFKNAAENGLSVLSADANAYAAALSDKVINIPMTSSEYDVLDRDIPLYQLVFKGITDISAPINTANNPQKRFLEAIACGSGMTFVLSADYDSRFATSKHSAFAVSLIDDNLKLISELSAKSKDYYTAVSGAKIEKYTQLSDTLSMTEFDNGVTVWVNRSDSPVEVSGVTVESGGFMFKEGE